MWAHVVGPILEGYHPKFNPKTAEDVDILLSAEIEL